MSKSTQLQRVELAKLRFDGDTQMRESLNGEAVREYAEAMKAGTQFPPAIVFYDGSDYWLGDGFHRWHAASEAGIKSMECEVRQGSMRDAILFACSANSSHGLRRTNADKYKAVMTLLKDEEWSQWSDHIIAEKCGVSQPFVGKLRASLITVISQPKRKGRDGRTCKVGNRKSTVKAECNVVQQADSEPALIDVLRAAARRKTALKSPGLSRRNMTKLKAISEAAASGFMATDLGNWQFSVQRAVVLPVDDDITSMRDVWKELHEMAEYGMKAISSNTSIDWSKQHQMKMIGTVLLLTKHFLKALPVVKRTDSKASFTCPNCSGTELQTDDEGSFCKACKEPVPTSNRKTRHVAKRTGSEKEIT